MSEIEYLSSEEAWERIAELRAELAAVDAAAPKGEE